MGDDPLPPLIDAVLSGPNRQADRRRNAIFVEISNRLGEQAKETDALRTWVAALHEVVAAIVAEDRTAAQLRDDLDSVRAQLEELRRIEAAPTAKRKRAKRKKERR